MILKIEKCCVDFLPTFLPTCLPTFLPTCLPTFLPTFLPNIWVKLHLHVSGILGKCFPICFGVITSSNNFSILLRLSFWRDCSWSEFSYWTRYITIPLQTWVLQESSTTPPELALLKLIPNAKGLPSSCWCIWSIPDSTKKGEGGAHFTLV